MSNPEIYIHSPQGSSQKAFKRTLQSIPPQTDFFTPNPHMKLQPAESATNKTAMALLNRLYGSVDNPSRDNPQRNAAKLSQRFASDAPLVRLQKDETILAVTLLQRKTNANSNTHDAFEIIYTLQNKDNTLSYQNAESKAVIDDFEEYKKNASRIREITKADMNATFENAAYYYLDTLGLDMATRLQAVRAYFDPAEFDARTLQMYREAGTKTATVLRAQPMLNTYGKEVELTNGQAIYLIAAAAPKMDKPDVEAYYSKQGMVDNTHLTEKGKAYLEKAFSESIQLIFEAAQRTPLEQGKQHKSVAFITPRAYLSGLSAESQEFAEKCYARLVATHAQNYPNILPVLGCSDVKAIQEEINTSTVCLIATSETRSEQFYALEAFNTFQCFVNTNPSGVATPLAGNNFTDARFGADENLGRRYGHTKLSGHAALNPRLIEKPIPVPVVNPNTNPNDTTSDSKLIEICSNLWQESPRKGSRKTLLTKVGAKEKGVIEESLEGIDKFDHTAFATPPKPTFYIQKKGNFEPFRQNLADISGQNIPVLHQWLNEKEALCSQGFTFSFKGSVLPDLFGAKDPNDPKALYSAEELSEKFAGILGINTFSIQTGFITTLRFSNTVNQDDMAEKITGFFSKKSKESKKTLTFETFDYLEINRKALETALAPKQPSLNLRKSSMFVAAQTKQQEPSSAAPMHP